MEPEQIRLRALELAVQSCGAHDGADDILDRADAFAVFIFGLDAQEAEEGK